MKKVRHIATFADLLILAIVVIINPTSPITPYHPFKAPCISDKVEVRYTKALSTDSLTQSLKKTDAQLSEMKYYLKVHNVTDEGYNQVARYNQTLLDRKDWLQRISELSAANKLPKPSSQTITIPAKERQLIAVKLSKGHWHAGRYTFTPLYGKALTRDYQGRIVSAVYAADTVVSAIRIDSAGIYRGQVDSYLQANGQGTYLANNGEYYEGHWQYDRRNGFGFLSSPFMQLKAGEWKNGRFLGERLRYTSERIYGIDISRHQHEKGRKRYGIDWSKVRITSLGARHNAEGRTFPISFVYIKSTEGTNIRNRYFMTDYMKAKKQGIRVGAYHFFSLKSAANAQANYFVNHTLFRKGDFPPVLDVEPSDAQIRKIGGDEELMRRIRIFMDIVERRTGMRPILYISQSFINHHMNNATDIKQKYNVWIARYGQYKPDVKLVYWQLCPDGKVDGITGDVDINVFNGYQAQFDEFIRTGFHE